jgi:hypothetical protein
MGPPMSGKILRTAGKNIQIGDVLATWSGKKRVVALKPYSGPLSFLWPEGAMIAEFDIGTGMTIGAGEWLDVVNFDRAEA